LRIEVSYERGLLRIGFQQPDVDNVLLVLVTPVLLVPVGTLRPVVPDTPVLHVPRSEICGMTTVGLVTGSSIWGVGRPVIWLTPKLPTSRDPNGIPTGVPVFLDDDPVAVDVVVVMPEDDVLDAVEQVFNSVETVGLVDMVAFMPPPSKLERTEVLPATWELDAMALGARTLIQPVLPTLPEELIVPMDSGVSMPDVIELGVDKPPGFISRAPRGIPVGPTGLGSEPSVGEPSVERGEVAPIAGVVAVMTCAKLGPLDNSAIAMAISKLGLATLCSFRIGTTVLLGLESDSPGLFGDDASSRGSALP
jgi:hypothetical protein